MGSPDGAQATPPAPPESPFFSTLTEVQGEGRCINFHVLVHIALNPQDKHMRTCLTPPLAVTVPLSLSKSNFPRARGALPPQKVNKYSHFQSCVVAAAVWYCVCVCARARVQW